MRNSAMLLLVGAILATILNAAPALSAAEPRVPVIYSTDLYQPHMDLDDHFDLAQLFSMPELDIKGIILDDNGKVERSGQPAVDQMMAMTGRRIRTVMGLKDPLSSLTDTGAGQPREFQHGVEMILSVLRDAAEPVYIVTAGSVRDVTAAFNREPELMRKEVRGVYINIGNPAIGGNEYNVDLDAAAFRALVQSGLPVVWFPCFPADHPNATYWRFDWKPMLEAGAIPRPLRNYFIYAMEKVDPRKVPPLDALKDDFRPDSRGAGQYPKEMWCTPSLLEVAGRKVYRIGEGQWVARREPPAGAAEERVWRIVPARVELDQRGKPTRFELNAANANIKVIQRSDAKTYERVMNACLMDLYRKFPMAAAQQN